MKSNKPHFFTFISHKCSKAETIRFLKDLYFRGSRYPSPWLIIPAFPPQILYFLLFIQRWGDATFLTLIVGHSQCYTFLRSSIWHPNAGNNFRFSSFNCEEPEINEGSGYSKDILGLSVRLEIWLKSKQIWRQATFSSSLKDIWFPCVTFFLLSGLALSSFIHQILITYHMLGTAVGTKNTAVNKTDRIMEFRLEWKKTGKTQINE